MHAKYQKQNPADLTEKYNCKSILRALVMYTLFKMFQIILRPGSELLSWWSEAWDPLSDILRELTLEIKES